MSLLIPKQGKRKKKPNANKDKSHLRSVGELVCCCTGKRPVEVHHLLHEPESGPLYGLSHGIGKKNGDEWVIPLLPSIHITAHMTGRPEKYIHDKYGINPWKLAQDLYAASGNHEKMISAIFRARVVFDQKIVKECLGLNGNSN